MFRRIAHDLGQNNVSEDKKKFPTTIILKKYENYITNNSKNTLISAKNVIDDKRHRFIFYTKIYINNIEIQFYAILKPNKNQMAFVIFGSIWDRT